MSEVVSMGRPWDLARHRLGRRRSSTRSAVLYLAPLARAPRARVAPTLETREVQVRGNGRALLAASGSPSAHLSQQWHRLARRTSLH
ncbi:MAG: hypothetical protein M3495_15630 [Pseudomonadota bacterium]|nr:hypothetical protein [Gammaproteobacteria bacterium]MDQ3582933.1 hypothetical protein [Pseudomonadota bacterium]